MEAIIHDQVFYPAWSKDSRAIYFTPRRNGGDDLWRVSLDGTDARPVTDLSARVGRVGRPALATDGAFLYFTWEQDRGDIWVVDVAR